MSDSYYSTGNSIPNEAAGTAEDLKQRAGAAWEKVQEQGSQLASQGTTYAREHPLPTAFIGFGVGLIIGLSLGHRHEPTLQERYIERPLHQSKGAVLGMLVGLAALLRKTLESSAATVRNQAGEVRDGVRDTVDRGRDAADSWRKKAGL